MVYFKGPMLSRLLHLQSQPEQQEHSFAWLSIDIDIIEQFTVRCLLKLMLCCTLHTLQKQRQPWFDPGWEEVVVTLVTSQRANIFVTLHFMVGDARKIRSLTGKICTYISIRWEECKEEGKGQCQSQPWDFVLLFFPIWTSLMLYEIVTSITVSFCSTCSLWAQKLHIQNEALPPANSYCSAAKCLSELEWAVAGMDGSRDCSFAFPVLFCICVCQMPPTFNMAGSLTNY